MKWNAEDHRTARIAIIAIAAVIIAVVISATAAEIADAKPAPSQPSASASSCQTRACWQRVREARRARWCARHARCIWRKRFERQPASWQSWARSTERCESRDVGPHGHDLATGRTYHGALQFSLSTWSNAQRYVPRSWRSYADPHTLDRHQQLVVGIALARAEGAQHWPVCG
jgi:hypothetical protein